MKSSLMLLGCLCMLSLAAQAQQKAPAKPAPPPPVNSRKACQADMQKFCGTVQPGRGRMRHCLNEHSSALSAACRDALRKTAPKGPTQKKPASQGAPTTA